MFKYNNFEKELQASMEKELLKNNKQFSSKAIVKSASKKYADEFATNLISLLGKSSEESEKPEAHNDTAGIGGLTSEDIGRIIDSAPGVQLIDFVKKIIDVAHSDNKLDAIKAELVEMLSKYDFTKPEAREELKNKIMTALKLANLLKMANNPLGAKKSDKKRSVASVSSHEVNYLDLISAASGKSSLAQHGPWTKDCDHYSLLRKGGRCSHCGFVFKPNFESLDETRAIEKEFRAEHAHKKHHKDDDNDANQTQFLNPDSGDFEPLRDQERPKKPKHLQTQFLNPIENEFVTLDDSDDVSDANFKTPGSSEKDFIRMLEMIGYTKKDLKSVLKPKHNLNDCDAADDVLNADISMDSYTKDSKEDWEDS